jgi:hypothetical protein
MTNEELKTKLPTMTINNIAALILADWKNVYFGAKPYLQAMFCVSKLSDTYGCEDGETQVRYFLGNAQTWRGDRAKLIKAELNRRLKAA